MEELNRAYSLDVKQRKLTFIFNYAPPKTSNTKKVGVVKKVGVSITKLSPKDIASKCKSVAMVTNTKDVAMEMVTPNITMTTVINESIAMTTESVKSEEVTMTTTEDEMLNISPRAATKYSLRQNVKLSQKKINAIETSSPLSDIGNIGITGVLFHHNNASHQPTNNNTTHTNDVPHVSCTSNLSTCTNVRSDVHVSSTSDIPTTCSTTANKITEVYGVHDREEDKLTPDDFSIKESIGRVVPHPLSSCDFFPPPQNLLTPPSTGSETESTDTDIPPIGVLKHTTTTQNKKRKSSTMTIARTNVAITTVEREGEGEKTCAICDNTDELVTCAGHCMRSFHSDCLGIITLPKDFTCDECTLMPTICYLCKKYRSENSGELMVEKDFLVSCSHVSCSKHYHISCVRKKFPENFKITPSPSLSSPPSLICGLHSCAKCTSQQSTPMTNKGRLLHCTQCPLALHSESCLIAGCETIDDKRMLCYRHISLASSLPQSVKHFNMNSCLHCGEVGSLICCDFCSAAYHVECLPDEHQSGCGQEEWYCPYCMNHDLPTYGSIVMVKCGVYR